MHLEKQFDVDKPRDSAAKVVAQDETLLGLFPDAEVEIVESLNRDIALEVSNEIGIQPVRSTKHRCTDIGITISLSLSGRLSFCLCQDWCRAIEQFATRFCFGLNLSRLLT